MSPSPLPPATRMGPVTLRVRSLAREAVFFRDVVGLPVRREEPGRIELGADETVLVLDEDADAPARGPRTSGLFHVAILLPTRGDLAGALRHLLESGWPLEGASDHLVSEALYLSDPEGNGLELYRDRPREAWTFDGAGRLHMATRPLDAAGLLAEGKDEPWRGMSAGTRVGHVHLNVGDVARAEAFFRDVVGMDVTARYAGSATFLSAGGYHHHVAANTWNGAGVSPPPEGSLGLEEYVLLVPGRGAMEAVAARAAEAGLPLREDAEGLRLRDPAGALLRLSAL